jgi:hypothetical protein
MIPADKQRCEHGCYEWQGAERDSGIRQSHSALAMRDITA